MLVKCINNDFSKIESHWVKNNFDAYNNINERLVKGETYVVYAIEVSKVPFVYVVEDEDFGFYPIQFPIELFEIIDNRLSKYFCYGWSEINTKDGVEKSSLIAFKEWVGVENFWEELSTDNIEYEEVFKRYKELLDFEYFNPKLLINTKLLKILDDDWVMCDACNESWEVKIEDEMIKCPKCKMVYKNPFV